MAVTHIKPCICGAEIDPERDLDPVQMAYFELHLRACGLRKLDEIHDRLAELVEAQPYFSTRSTR